MEKKQIKIIIVLGIILVILIIIFAVLNLSRQQKKESVIVPTPTQEPFTGEEPTTVVTPEQINPGDFTGVLEEELPPEVRAESEQMQDLSYKVPITQPLFEIDFNWEEYKFVVTLKDPEDQARTAFEDWLKNNYSGIPLNQFIIN